MKSKFLSGATAIVGALVIAGTIAAIAIPSLMRARVSSGISPVGMDHDRGAPPPTYGAREQLMAGGIVGGVVGGVPGHVANTESYSAIVDNGFVSAAKAAVSTFSVDVDTASYANVRRFLTGGQLPPADAVRIEELINYFRFEYPQPSGDDPFSVTTSVGECPWKPGHKLVHVGLQARRIENEDTPPRNLVFLLDVSGSMNDPAKLPLLKAAMRLLVDELNARDRVAIVVYAGAAGLVLPSTPGDQEDEIRAAIDRLEAGGSTAGGAGIQLAYAVAQEAFIDGGVNRVILGTDGDFNVGVTTMGGLQELIEDKRRSGVFLSVLGFGTGNLKDSTMEMLADRGNGNYAYIDSLAEGRKVLVAEAGSTLVTVAKDVKIQVEFDAAAVASYRLIGYENRVLAREDFEDDRKDAGEIGAGHTVTALYEIVPAPGARNGGRLATVKLRYKAPDSDTSRPLEAHTVDDAGDASPELRFTAAVAEFGMLLRNSDHKGQATFEQALELGRGAIGNDPHGYRAEFVRLVEQAQRLSGKETALVGS